MRKNMKNEEREIDAQEDVNIEKLFESQNNEIIRLNQELEKEKNRADDFVNQAQRLQAEFSNYRKRTIDDCKKAKEDGVMDTVAKILPLLDSFSHALAMITDSNVAQGIRMLERQFIDTLASMNVTEIEALNKEFNPELHSAVMQAEAESEEEKGTVTQVFQKGYKMGEKVIRHAMVKVAN